MDRLDDNDRGLLELVAIDGLTIANAANVLGMSHVAARVRLQRARKKLRLHLANPITGPTEISRALLKEARP